MYIHRKSWWMTEEPAMTVELAAKMSAIAVAVGGVLWVVSQALESLAAVANTLGV